LIALLRVKVSRERKKVSNERKKVSSERVKVSRERKKVSTERVKVSRERKKVSSERVKVSSILPVVSPGAWKGKPEACRDSGFRRTPEPAQSQTPGGNFGRMPRFRLCKDSTS
jgi:hypothetical protein